MSATSHRALGHTVRLICRACHHESTLDLGGLIERGRGDQDLRALRFRCRLCLSRDVGFLVLADTRAPTQPSFYERL
jgi:hypothetical protein